MKFHSCNYCERIFLTADVSSGESPISSLGGKYFKFYFTNAEIQCAIKEGCPLLERISVGWPDHHDRPEEQTEIRISFYYLRPYRYYLKILRRTDLLKEGMGRATVLDLFTPADDSAASWLSTRPINYTPETRETYQLAQTWLSQCLHSHQHPQSKPQDGGPKRLLRIQKVDGCYKVTLVRALPHNRYIALSYCWGGDQKHKTTKATLPHYVKGIDYESLPATIQDAIKVTWEIGHQYIWVDSLSITQDDDDEMAMEISKMPMIYRNAICTITASSADTAYAGFLRRPEHQITRIRIQNSDNNEHQYIYALEVDGFAEVPLESRGWTLQERLLSPRILSFGYRQMRWHCDAVPETESLTDGWMKYHEVSTYEWSKTVDGIPTSGSRQLLGPSLSALSGSHLNSSWIRIVEDFTQRRLSVTHDRVLAISGIAHALGEKFGNSDEYVAGLWLKSLPCSLPWKCYFFRCDGTPWEDPRPSKYQGPSWSWISVNRKIRFPYFDQWLQARTSDDLRFHPRIEILAVGIKLQCASALYGAVLEAVLTVRGRLKEVQCIDSPGGRAWAQKKLKDPLGIIDLSSGVLALDYPTADFAGGKDNDEPMFILDLGQEIYEEHNRLGQQYMIVLREAASVNGRRRFSRLGVVQFDGYAETSRRNELLMELRKRTKFEVFLDCHEEVVELF